MPTLRLTGLRGLDGNYEFDWTFSAREHHRIRQVSGLRPTEYLDAFVNGDAGFRVALTDIILTREDKTYDLDELWETELKNLWVQLDDEDGQSPPAGTPGENAGGSASSGRSSRKRSATRA